MGCMIVTSALSCQWMQEFERRRVGSRAAAWWPRCSAAANSSQPAGFLTHPPTPALQAARRAAAVLRGGAARGGRRGGGGAGARRRRAAGRAALPRPAARAHPGPSGCTGLPDASGVGAAGADRDLGRVQQHVFLNQARGRGGGPSAGGIARQGHMLHGAWVAAASIGVQQCCLRAAKRDWLSLAAAGCSRASASCETKSPAHKALPCALPCCLAAGQRRGRGGGPRVAHAWRPARLPTRADALCRPPCPLALGPGHCQSAPRRQVGAAVSLQHLLADTWHSCDAPA